LVDVAAFVLPADADLDAGFSGTFAPSSLASDHPIAIACAREVRLVILIYIKKQLYLIRLQLLGMVF
jgi:hypothetical protein